MLDCIKPTTKAKMINKKFEVVVVKKLPVVFRGNISTINTIKKGIINFFSQKHLQKNE